MNGAYAGGPPPPDSNHVFALLADYTDSLDSLPLELTRSFSDLRELDAVLRTSINAITSKITTLTTLLQDPTATPASRLFLLREIADAASHLKMGGEDKIRVAGIAAENLATHQTHIHTVLKTMSMVAPPAAHCANGSDFDPTSHARRTTFPHVAPALEHASAPSPQKRRRVGEGRPVNGGGAYGNSNGRAPPKRKPPVQTRQLSPSDSLRSFGAAGYSNHHATNGFYENGYGHHNSRHHEDDDGTDDDAVANHHTSSSRSRKPPRRSNNGPTHANTSHTSGNPHEDNSLMDVVIAHPSDDEDHSFRPPEEPLYCSCKRVSFGEMIACDNDECPFEWFHLACVGITKPLNTEKWYCDRCREDATRKANAETPGNGNDTPNASTTTNGTKPGRGGL
ncbi:transcriptional regulatory protein PHO23 [Ceratobasidium sp. AG-Ba]|nr:transcriptional regulatory protein PHO23 [Ceratobasidium sp. AG-Ba]